MKSFYLVFLKFKLRLLVVLWLVGIVGFELMGCRNTHWENLSEQVHYVGPQSCRPCHADIFDRYQRTGMGRSWYRPRPEEQIEDFGSDAHVYDSHADLHYRPYWRGDSLYILEYRLCGNDTIYRRCERIDYIVGSGHQTRSYVIERNGFLYEAPITWYVSRRLWDLSPGYHDGHNSRFDRPLGTECVHCHNAYTEAVPGTLNRYLRIPLGIDCERCHGPGSLHVQRMLKGEEVDIGKQPDYSIVNPSKLSLEFQFDVCQQCHLQGVNIARSSKEFRPGLRLSDVRDVFLVAQPDTDAFGIASHAARLRQSICFKRSGGQLTCTTCHDPHTSIRELPADHYQRACKNCHAADHRSCTLNESDRAAKEHNCIACHMPRGNTSDIPHVQFTDHYIRRKPNLLTKASSVAQPVLSYVKLLCATSQAPEPHVIGKAWLAYYEQHDSRRFYLERAWELLPDTCFDARSRVLFYLGRVSEALPLARKAYEQNPADNLRAFHYAQVLEAAGNLDVAREQYLKLFERNKALTEAANRAVALLLKTQAGRVGALRQAERVLSEAIREQPHKAETYANIGFVYLNLNRPGEAWRQLHRALYLNPDQRVALLNMTLLQERLGQADSAAYYRERLKHVESVHSNKFPKNS